MAANRSKSVKRRSDAAAVADLCVEAQTRLSEAGRALHDNAGSLLAAAGLRLQLLAADYPEAAEGIAEVSGVLGQAMESVRSVSQRLHPSPVYRIGLKRALERLEVNLDYAATAALAAPMSEAVYRAAEAAVRAAREAGAREIHIRARGARGLTLRVADNGTAKGRTLALGPIVLLAQAAGVRLTRATGKGTIVLIRVPASARSSGG